MGRELTPSELQELLSLHALDAVDGDERAQLEEWLERTPEARRELDELRETAASLAYGHAEAPSGLWERIEGALSEEPPALAVPIAGARSSRSRRRGLAMRITAGVAAASAVAATVTAIVLSDEMAEQQDRLEGVAASVEHEGMERAAAAALADPRAMKVELTGDAGSGTAMVVTLPGGRGFVMSDDVRRLPEGRTYQLWAMTGPRDAPTLVPTALLGRSLDLLAFHSPSPVFGFAITDEVAPGVNRSTRGPMLSGTYGEDRP